jgi:hypothetical protein
MARTRTVLAWLGGLFVGAAIAGMIGYVVIHALPLILWVAQGAHV